jgi:hypothetical protein
VPAVDTFATTRAPTRQTAIAMTAALDLSTRDALMAQTVTTAAIAPFCPLLAHRPWRSRLDFTPGGTAPTFI